MLDIISFYLCFLIETVLKNKSQNSKSMLLQNVQQSVNKMFIPTFQFRWQVHSTKALMTLVPGNLVKVS